MQEEHPQERIQEEPPQGRIQEEHNGEVMLSTFADDLFETIEELRG